MDQAEELATYARDPRTGEQEVPFRQFERSIVGRVFGIGCTAVALFLASCQARLGPRIPRWLVQGGRTFERKSPRHRPIMTWFGSVRYWRTYMLEKDAPNGGHDQKRRQAQSPLGHRGYYTIFDRRESFPLAT
jgi:hypothetical protein